MGEPDHRYETQLLGVEPATESEQTDTSSSSSSSSTTSSSSSSSTTAIYYDGRFTVPNLDHKLRIDMTAQVSVVVSKAAQALVIPSTALGARGKDGRYTVKVLEGGPGPGEHVAQRQVRIGLNNRVKAQVLDGLKAGDLVVVGEGSSKSSSSNSRGGPPPMF
jgi:macrolide-specific efflux system membrane fusion protein